MYKSELPYFVKPRHIIVNCSIFNFIYANLFYLVTVCLFLPLSIPPISLPFLFFTYFIHLFPCFSLFFFPPSSLFLQLHFLQSHKCSRSFSLLVLFLLCLSHFFCFLSSIYSAVSSFLGFSSCSFLSSLVILLRLL